MELDSTSIEFTPLEDRRRRIEEPPPVRLVTVADARLPAPAGLETELDRFYAGLLRLERDADRSRLLFRAENFAIVFEVVEPPIVRDNLRMLGIEVPSLDVLEHQLIDRELEYAWQKGLTPGQESIVLTDPGGNWVQISEMKTL